jgi:hypothetical protein
VKNLARLALFFSISFAVLLLAGAGMRFLVIQVDWMRTLPRQPEQALTALIAAGRWALSLALYGSLLLSLSYAARRRIFVPPAVICLFALSLGLSFGVTTALEHWGNVPPASAAGKPLGGPGLILTNTLSGNETAIVLLRGPAEPKGPRVAAIPGRPLSYQEEAPGGINEHFSLPPVPFRDENPWFLKSIAIDLKLSAGQFAGRFAEGLPPFLMYAGALIFVLCSLGFILKLSAWPLANLFFGCLAFRGILALEIFFNSPEMQDVFDSFLKSRLPLPLTVPLIFCGFGLLVYLYSALVYLAKKRGDDED